MAARRKKESMKKFMARKAKNYAEYCDIMRPGGSDLSINSLKFGKARLRHNKAL